MKKIAFIFIISIFLLQPWRAASGDGGSPAGKLLQLWFKPVSRDDAYVIADPRLNPRAALTRFYQRRGFQPAWIGYGGPLSQLDILMQAIGHAPADGLRARDYDFWNSETGIGHDAFFSEEPVLLNDQDLASLDVALTEVMLRYAAHLSEGRARPEEFPESFTGYDKHPLKDLPGELAEAVNENRLESFIEELSPQHQPYRAIKETLQRYMQIQADGGWPRIAEGSKLRIGYTGARVKALHRHLAITGDLQADAWLPDDRFGPPLEAAVKRFQRRHGLEIDGIVGTRTLAALNIPVETRMIQLMLNMERWRWLPEDLGSRYVMVNIPGFDLRLVEDRTEVLCMRAIVGQKSRPTPVLSSQLTYLEVNPYWNIPQKIARRDVLPKIQVDPGHLVRQGIRVFDSWNENAPALDPFEIDWERLSQDYFPFRLRQDPSARNALGRVKFMFPNPQSVYIHDTPGKSMFNHSRRLFSSGCVRVEDPLALALHILKDQHWNRRRLEQAVKSKANRTVILRNPIPVYLVYFTAWVDTGGDVHFSDDIYDHDRRLLVALLKDSPSYALCSFIAGSSYPAEGCSRDAL